jgi:hypothetical protein
MISKLLTKKYFFSLTLLIVMLFLLITVGFSSKSSQQSTAVKITLVGLLVILFFDFLKIRLNRERTSYRTMLMERPMFNARAKVKSPELVEPLFPRYIALYFDADDIDPYNSHVYSIQAVRYEQGYLTDSLFLPLKKEGVKNKPIKLSLEEALKYLKSYTRDFPLVVHEKDFANTWLREHSSSILLNDAIDAEALARMMYPKLKEFGIEDLNDWYRFEVDERDPVYGAKIASAIYLDYQRIHGYYTKPTFNPFAKQIELRPIYPEDHQPRADLSFSDDFSFWVENEPEFQVKKMEGSENYYDQTKKEPHYIGPFTPLDEHGMTIPDRGQLIDKNKETP